METLSKSDGALKLELEEKVRELDALKNVKQNNLKLVETLKGMKQRISELETAEVTAKNLQDELNQSRNDNNMLRTKNSELIKQLNAKVDEIASLQTQVSVLNALVSAKKPESILSSKTKRKTESVISIKAEIKFESVTSIKPESVIIFKSESKPESVANTKPESVTNIKMESTVSGKPDSLTCIKPESVISIKQESTVKPEKNGKCFE